MVEYGSQMGTMQGAPQQTMQTGRTMTDVLNELRSRELAVIEQYMRHHYQVTTIAGLAMQDEFKDIAITEMKHAEKLAERIDYLGGDPTTKPAPIGMDARTVEQMASMDLASENDAVRLYRDAIRQADAAGDVTTRRLLEGILGDEEDHVNTFGMMLGR